MREPAFRRISPEDQKSVKDFFRDAKDFAPEDIGKFMGNVEKYAERHGGAVNVEKSSSNDALGIELWLEHAARVTEARRLFAVRRLANVIPIRGGKHVLSASGPYYLSRDITPVIAPYAILISPAVLCTDAGNLIEMLRNIRIIKLGKDIEKVREARYDLHAACRGTRVGFVDLFSGERMETLGF